MKIKTKSGIQLEIDERITDDMRFARLFSKLRKDKTADTSFELIDFIFGGGENTEKFMDAVAEHNDGICTQEALASEITEILQALNTKKS
jgi:hypothetical protein